jgi:antitoxin VapB
MGVQLNIKSAEARRLAEELAAESGESITQAVTEALRERLKNVRRERGVSPEVTRKREKGLQEIVKGSRALWREDLLNSDYNDMLYDERGLPL